MVVEAESDFARVLMHTILALLAIGGVGRVDALAVRAGVPCALQEVIAQNRGVAATPAMTRVYCTAILVIALFLGFAVVLSTPT